jgi:hypothetical protein
VADKDPLELTQEEASAFAHRSWNWLTDRVRAFATAKLLGIIAAVAATVAAAAYVLPALVSAAFAVCATLLAVWAIQSHRLLHRERRIEAWRAVDSLRAQQREIRAKIEVRQAAVIVAGRPGQADAALHGYQPLVAAVRWSNARARLATQPAQTPPQRQRAAAPPKPPDLEQVVREIKDLRMQNKAVEARIQALAAADPEFERDADEKAEAWQRARAADLEARDRARKGKRPTAERGELGFQLGLRRDGTPSSTRLPRKPTPEQTARGENAA